MDRSRPDTLGHVNAVDHIGRVAEALGAIRLDHALRWVELACGTGCWEFELFRLPHLSDPDQWPGRRWFRWAPDSGWCYRVPGTELEVWVRQGPDRAWSDPVEVVREINEVAHNPRRAWSHSTVYA